LRGVAAPIYVPIAAFTFCAVLACVVRAGDPLPIKPAPGTGMFLMLSDIHFDPYADAESGKELGTKLAEGCAAGVAASPRFGSDTNRFLLQSTLHQAAAVAAENHFHYDYVIVTGDFLAHGFDARYRKCVAAPSQLYGKFAADTVALVSRLIAQELPGAPVFAALGNNDSDHGDYATPSPAFLEKVGEAWSGGWEILPPTKRTAMRASFAAGGYYVAPDPIVPKHAFVVLNSNYWSAHNARACTPADPDPGGQFQWLHDRLAESKGAGDTATLVMHIPPGINALPSTMGPPKTLWNEACTERFVSVLAEFPGSVRQIYAGHIHRDDFRLLPDPEGNPMVAIHILPAVSPIYLDNPAFEIGWYDKSTGELRDYATQFLDLRNIAPEWATEYVFSRAYGGERPDLASLDRLARTLRAGNPHEGLGKQYAQFYGVGVSMLMSPANWLTYSCSQTEMTVSGFVQCQHRP